MNQSEAARQSGVSFATINRMCTNATSSVSLEVIDQLCGILDVDVGELFERDKKRGRK